MILKIKKIKLKNLNSNKRFLRQKRSIFKNKIKEKTITVNNQQLNMIIKWRKLYLNQRNSKKCMKKKNLKD